MADIEIKCSKCYKVIMVSEFADLSSIVCRSCGEKLQKTETPTSKQQPAVRGLKLQKSEGSLEQETSATDEDKEAPKEWRFYRHMRKNEKPARKFRMTHHFASWIIFVVLGGIMGFLRYGGGFSADHIELIKEFGPIVVIATHIIITLKAFKDSMFQGILCLLVPMYSFYYLFLVSDAFYVRAVVGSLLIGIGQDSFLVLQEKAVSGITAVDNYIQSGG